MEETNIPTGETKETTEETKKCDTQHNCNCRISLMMNIVLFAAIVVLYILHFMGNGSGEIDTATLQKSNKAVTVGFVNSDSIMANYDMVEHMKDSLVAQTKIYEAQFTAAQSSFETQVLAYQKKIKDNTLSIEQATATEKTLTKLQENLLTMKEELTNKLADQELELNVVLQDSIMSCLKRYNKRYNFDYILGFSKGSGILYANDSLNITSEIIKELNKEYKSKK